MRRLAANRGPIRCGLLLAGPALLLGCGSTGNDAPTPAAPRPAFFAEITDDVGLSFSFDRATSGDYFMPDSMAAGCAFLDFDRDGDLDLYLVNGFHGADTDASGLPAGANRLFRQEADGRFVDVSRASGAADAGYGMGVAVGDIDNDGYPDLYVTNFGPDALYRNNGDGTFADVTVRAGLGDPRWGASAGFFDYDDDGFLDLFVTNYVEYDADRRVTDVAGRPEYPGPDCCPGVPDALYRNNGDGTFADVSRAAGIAAKAGKGLGVAFLDFDDDGRLDVFVANDREANRAWLQNGDGTFTDRGELVGVAYNVYGNPEASMGVVLADLDGDLRVDLFLTHLVQETNTLYLGRGPGAFVDATLGSGLGRPSLDYTGFGAAAIDPDLDGDLDLLVVNGRVLRSLPRPSVALSPHWAPYAEENQLFLNEGAARFRLAMDDCGAPCAEVGVSRGLAVGDVDRDGDLDALVTGGDGRARLYRSTPLVGEHHWLVVRALERGGRRDAPGAVVFVRTGDRTLRREVAPTSSYLSSSDPRAFFGLGDAAAVDEVRVRWPDGDVESFGALAVDRFHEVVHGDGSEVR